MREAEALRLQVHQMSAIRKVYELSKRITMIRDEQIIAEAKKHYYDDINCHNAFLHGVEWAELHPANVWHDASEEPKFGEDVIAIDIDGISVAGVYKDYNGKGIYRYHCFLCEWDAVDKWAYVSDLLPKGGEE